MYVRVWMCVVKREIKYILPVFSIELKFSLSIFLAAAFGINTINVRHTSLGRNSFIIQWNFKDISLLLLQNQDAVIHHQTFCHISSGVLFHTYLFCSYNFQFPIPWNLLAYFSNHKFNFIFKKKSKRNNSNHARHLIFFLLSHIFIF